MHPGVTIALSLTLVAASLVGWQGPARGMRTGMPRSGTGAPGAHKGEFGAAGVSSNPGAELTAALDALPGNCDQDQDQDQDL